jgi:hypothetical protein
MSTIAEQGKWARSPRGRVLHLFRGGYAVCGRDLPLPEPTLFDDVPVELLHAKLCARCEKRLRAEA